MSEDFCPGPAEVPTSRYSAVLSVFPWLEWGTAALQSGEREGGTGEDPFTRRQ